VIANVFDPRLFVTGYFVTPNAAN
jgi:hypothetical protein